MSCCTTVSSDVYMLLSCTLSELAAVSVHQLQEVLFLPALMAGHLLELCLTVSCTALYAARSFLLSYF